MAAVKLPCLIQLVKNRSGSGENPVSYAEKDKKAFK
jgi:hypothetical protein